MVIVMGEIKKAECDFSLAFEGLFELDSMLTSH